MLEQNKIYLGNCLEIMKDIDSKSIDMILCDLPYGTTKCKWDSVIPFKELWEQYNRIIIPNGAIVLFGSEPFSSKLRLSNEVMYKYDWYWRKSKANGFLNAKKMPLKDIETISVFYAKPPNYNPQGILLYNKEIVNPKGKLDNTKHVSGHNGGAIKEKSYIRKFTNYPHQVLDFQGVARPIHNTQKPEELYKYLAKTYTNEGNLILDNCCGSGTIKTVSTIGRNYIGIEKEEEFYNMACERKFEAS